MAALGALGQRLLERETVRLVDVGDTRVYGSESQVRVVVFAFLEQYCG